MIFGRSRTQKAWIPGGTFFVPLEWSDGTEYPLTCVEGLIVAADTHAHAEQRSFDIIEQLQGVRMPRCPVSVIDGRRAVRTEIPNGTFIVQSRWTPTSSPVVKNCYGWVILADNEGHAQELQNEIVTGLLAVARAQRRFEKQRPRR